MPRPFNRLPRGLLGLLDAKVGGQNPQELTDELRPVLEMFPFYHAQFRDALSGQTAGNAVVGTNSLATGSLTGPPADELWWVEHYAVKMDAGLAAGNGVILMPSMLSVSSSGGPSIPILLNSARNVANQIGWIAAAAADRPFLMIPGDVLGAWVEWISGIATTITGFAHVARIKI